MVFIFTFDAFITYQSFLSTTVFTWNLKIKITEKSKIKEGLRSVINIIKSKPSEVREKKEN